MYSGHHTPWDCYTASEVLDDGDFPTHFRNGERVELVRSHEIDWAALITDYDRDDSEMGEMERKGYKGWTALGKVGVVIDDMRNSSTAPERKIRWDDGSPTSWHDTSMLRTEDEDSKRGRREFALGRWLSEAEEKMAALNRRMDELMAERDAWCS